MHDAIRWRYDLYVKPHLLIHENLFAGILRYLRNRSLLSDDAPMCYLSADASNIGDRVSALGVQFLAGKQGIELFTSKVALATTFRILDWLGENRPGTKVVIGGGGLLQECFDPFWAGLLDRKIPFALFGVGANEMQGRKVLRSQLLREIAFRAVSLHVRDSWTRELLEYGKPERVTVGVCPSVNYLNAKYGTGKEEPRKYLLHVQHPVDISMAGGDPERLRMVVKDTAAQLNLLYDETSHIKENQRSLVGRYLRARYVVSSRLHGCIFSYSLGIPFLPIVTDRKTLAFIDTHLHGIPVSDVNATEDELCQKIVSCGCRVISENITAALQVNRTAMNRVLEAFV